jgi:lauroyl/myristoyl acyltransferase
VSSGFRTAARKLPAADRLGERPDRVASRSRAWISAGDLGLVLKLPAAALIAALLPPARWERAASVLGGLAAHFGTNVGGVSTDKIAALISGQDVAGSPDAICRKLQRNHRLNQLHFVASWLPGGWPARIAVAGAHHVQAALDAGRGAVLWVAPFVFAPLVAKRALHECGFAVHHLSRPEHGFSSTVFGVGVLNPIRTRIEDRYLAERTTIARVGQTAAAVRTLAERLAANRVVSVTFADQGTRLIETPFLAGRLRVAPGAAHLALRSGASLLPVFALRTGTDAFRVEIGPQLSPSPGQDRNRQIEAMVAVYADELARRVRRWPEQFLWHDGVVQPFEDG